MFRFLTAGESHGPGLTVIVDGMPAGVSVTEDAVNAQLARRQRGYGRGDRMKIERDRAEIRGGVRHGLTLGSPVAMWIENRDFTNWTEAMSVTPAMPGADLQTETRVVPGHADLPGALKYLAHDLRNVLERASARETAARVAAGTIARCLLEPFGVAIRSRVVSIGTVDAPPQPETEVDWGAVEESSVRAADPETERRFIEVIDKARRDETTVGGVFQVVGFGVPAGLGSHVQWDRKLDGQLARAMMSINAVKGVELGPAFENTRRSGRDVHDAVVPDSDDLRRFRRLSNRAGGLEGGMTNGEPLVAYAAMKPIATMLKPLPSVDINTGEVVEAPYHRSDVCQVPPACVVGEAMMAIVLATAFLEKFGGDHIDEARRNYEAYVASHQEFGGSCKAR
jgi:chorismate synthase